MKKITCILLAMVLFVALSVPAFASTAIERIEAAKKLHYETNARLAEILASLDEQDGLTETQITSDGISPRLPCSQCGGPLK